MESRIMMWIMILLSSVSAHDNHYVSTTYFYSGSGCKTLLSEESQIVGSCDGLSIPCSDINDYSFKSTCAYEPHEHPTPATTAPPASEPTTAPPASAPTASEPTTAPTNPGNGGLDPHFRKLNGQLFSYHGECDLVLVSSNGFASGAGLDIHIRTKIKKFYSYIKVVSMRVGNATFEMEFKDHFHINGVFMDHPTPDFAGYHIVKVGNATWCRQKCSDAKIYKIFFDSVEYVELAYLAGFLHVEINGPNFEDSTGLLGNRRDLGKVGRDGELVKDTNEYGQDWQVLGSDPQLFRKSRYPQHPHPCILPKVTSRRNVDESTRRMAERACSYLSGELHEMCIFDVTATGDERLALSPFYN